LARSARGLRHPIAKKLTRPEGEPRYSCVRINRWPAAVGVGAVRPVKKLKAIWSNVPPVVVVADSPKTIPTADSPVLLVVYVARIPASAGLEYVNLTSSTSPARPPPPPASRKKAATTNPIRLIGQVPDDPDRSRAR